MKIKVVVLIGGLFSVFAYTSKNESVAKLAHCN